MALSCCARSPANVGSITFLTGSDLSSVIPKLKKRLNAQHISSRNAYLAGLVVPIKTLGPKRFAKVVETATVLADANVDVIVEVHPEDYPFFNSALRTARVQRARVPVVKAVVYADQTPLKFPAGVAALVVPATTAAEKLSVHVLAMKAQSKSVPKLLGSNSQSYDAWAAATYTGYNFYPAAFYEYDMTGVQLVSQTPIEGGSYSTFASNSASVASGQTWTDPKNGYIKLPAGTTAYWSTPAQIYPRGFPHLVKTAVGELNFDPADVNQGELGDCWFMSSLIETARLGRVNDSFTSVDETKGIYEIRLWAYNTSDSSFSLPVKVCVDGRLPTDASFNPLYCISDEVGEMWPSILEKAYARAVKQNQDYGYSAMDGGSLAVGAAQVMGGRCFLFNGSSPSGVWSDLNKLITAGHAIGVDWTSTPNNLVGGHEYAVMKTVSFTASGTTYQLIQVRNPWGKNAASDPNLEWTGDWGDNSPLWSGSAGAAAKAATGFTGPSADGAFWMDANDFVANMDFIAVCAPQPALKDGASITTYSPNTAPTYKQYANQVNTTSGYVYSGVSGVAACTTQCNTTQCTGFNISHANGSCILVNGPTTPNGNNSSYDWYGQTSAGTSTATGKTK